jgi:hypothetical protein
VIQTTIARGGGLLVLGAVRGLASEATPVVEQIARFHPSSIAVGISFDELTGLQAHFIGQVAEPLVPLTDSESAEVKGLTRFGEVRVPNPSLCAVLDWAAASGTPVEAVDPSDETYATLFTKHISYLELVRRTVRERKLTRETPKAGTPDEFAANWQASLSPGAGSRAFNSAREAALCESTNELLSRSGKVALLVDRERYDGVVGRLSGAAPKARGPG